MSTVDERALLSSHDAMFWAEQFVALAQTRPHIATDPGAMVCWFANAMGMGEQAQRERAERADPWRMDEWQALDDVCGIAGCDNTEIDQRGPVFLRGGQIMKVCAEHWGPIFRVLGEQVSWEHDAMRSGA